MGIKDTKAKDICERVVKDLKKKAEIENKEEHNEYFLLFVFWIYEEIEKKFGN